jgi:DNA polymerase V
MPCQTFCNRKSGVEYGERRETDGKASGRADEGRAAAATCGDIGEALGGQGSSGRGYHAFIDNEARQRATVPLMATSAECGFPSPADDYLDRPPDFNDLLIENPAATLAVRIAGESMMGVGLFPGDIAVVDRSRTPIEGSIVLALLSGEFTIKRYRKKGARIWLQAENPAFGDILLNDELRSVGGDHKVDPDALTWARRSPLSIAIISTLRANACLNRACAESLLSCSRTTMIV